MLVDNAQFSQVYSWYSLRGIYLSEGNYFRRKFMVRGQFSSGEILFKGNYPEGQLSGWQLSGGQFSSGAIVLEPWINIVKKKDFLQKFLLLLFYQSFLCLIMRNTFSDWLNAFRSFYPKLIPDYSIWQA